MVPPFSVALAAVKTLITLFFITGMFPNAVEELIPWNCTPFAAILGRLLFRPGIGAAATLTIWSLLISSFYVTKELTVRKCAYL